MQNNRILTLRFQNDLSPRELPLFRGCIIQCVGSGDANILYHNHITQGYRYSYPLIQYKIISNKACLTFLNEGVDAAEPLLSPDPIPGRLGKRHVLLQPASVDFKYFVLQPSDAPIYYSLTNWLPFNSDNYQKYQALEGMVRQIAFLENILVGNILSFAKGVCVHIDYPVVCEVIDIFPLGEVINKGIPLMSFNVSFRSNILLPDNIGLGKHASIGHGVLEQREI